MKVVLTEQESRDYFFTALCNGLEYVQSGYGILLEFDEKDYDNAKQSLKNKSINEHPTIGYYPNTDVGTSYEDVLIEILVLGGSLTMIDEEGEGDCNSTITIKEVYERVSETPISHLMDMIKENDDAVTADVIIQQVFFNEIIFG